MHRTLCVSSLVPTEGPLNVFGLTISENHIFSEGNLFSIGHRKAADPEAMYHLLEQTLPMLLLRHIGDKTHKPLEPT